MLMQNIKDGVIVCNLEGWPIPKFVEAPSIDGIKVDMTILWVFEDIGCLNVPVRITEFEFEELGTFLVDACVDRSIAIAITSVEEQRGLSDTQ